LKLFNDQVQPRIVSGSSFTGETVTGNEPDGLHDITARNQ